MSALLPAVMLLFAATGPVSSFGTCVLRPYNKTHVMACPDPQPPKHELVCRFNHRGHTLGAIVLNGELFRKDFPCELRDGCYVISKDTCPQNGYSIILKGNGVSDPAQCTDIMYSTLPSPEPRTTNSPINVTALKTSTRNVWRMVSLVVAVIILAVLAFGIFFKCRKKQKHPDPDTPNTHQDTDVVENRRGRDDTNSVSIPLRDGRPQSSVEMRERDGGSRNLTLQETPLPGYC